MSAVLSPIKLKEFVAAVVIFFAIWIVATLIVVPFSTQSPVELNARHHLVFKPGQTLPARSIEVACDGWCYHLTRFNSYRTPDWKPKSR